MIDPPAVVMFGPYRLVRALRPTPGAERFLALHERDQTSHVVHLFSHCHDRAEERRYLDALQAAASVDHPHVLRIERYSFEKHRPVVVTPFTGNQDGLQLLNELALAKGGRLSPTECALAAEQLLGASQHAHELGVIHGEIGAAEVQVNRRGSLLVSLYGLRRRLHGDGLDDRDARREEVRSIVSLMYASLTGLNAAEPRIPAGRLIRRLEPRWDEWFDEGLDPSGGFDSSEDAMDALVARRRAIVTRAASVRSMLGTVRRRAASDAPVEPPSRRQTR